MILKVVGKQVWCQGVIFRQGALSAPLACQWQTILPTHMVILIYSWALIPVEVARLKVKGQRYSLILNLLTSQFINYFNYTLWICFSTLEILISRERKCIKLNESNPFPLEILTSNQFPEDNCHIWLHIPGLWAMIPTVSLHPKNMTILFQIYSPPPSAVHLCYESLYL